MKMLANILIKFRRENKSNYKKDNRASYIIYKIVDQMPDKNIFILQCINTKAIFHLPLSNIVSDGDILYSLHPIQACYVGIEYAKSIKTASFISNKVAKKKINNQSVCRYGKYTLLFQNREKQICFLDKLTDKEFLMDPADIAISQELIQEFDASQAFYIGFLAGVKINRTNRKIKSFEKVYMPPKLKLIMNTNFNVG
ncbi:MAG: hypothetical protein E6K54_08060 [Gammaproteobacteria bacterium]|nr:MAG: hypothetical protein E6K54_08060 [Gammaproteobacteria bacterium]